jgi:NADP-dependent 3-hydroxy acid dehydrogenase YdfG
MNKGLADRVAIITGASSGIGAATARALGRAGARLTLAARRTDRLEHVAADVRASGGQAIVALCDVRERESIAAMIEQSIAAYGQIDVLFNNAGLGRLGWLESMESADVRLQIEVNLIGVIDATQLVLPHMIRRRSGHVINMASLAGKIGTPTYSVYAATKFALDGFTQALRREVAAWGVHVSGMYPGGVETEWGERVGYRRRTRVTTPRRARLSADDVARAVVKLIEYPRREVILPPTARVFVWLNRIAPGLIDWASRRFVSAERGDELNTR